MNKELFVITCIRGDELANLDGDLAWRYDKSTYECLKKNQRTEGVR